MKSLKPHFDAIYFLKRCWVKSIFSNEWRLWLFPCYWKRSSPWKVQRVFIYIIQTHVPRITFKNKWLHNIVALKARRTFCLASVNNLTGKWTSQVNIFTLMHQFQYFWTTTQSGLQSAPQTHTHSSIIATNFSQSHYISTLIIKNVNDFLSGLTWQKVVPLKPVGGEVRVKGDVLRLGVSCCIFGQILCKPLTAAEEAAWSWISEHRFVPKVSTVLSSDGDDGAQAFCLAHNLQ